MRISDWSSDVCSSDLLLLVRRNTDARIPDGESQTIFRGTADVQDDFTIVREFHCVGEEILQYLFQPQRVCFDAVRRIRGYVHPKRQVLRSEEHTSELQSLMRISYAVFCLTKKHYINITIIST